ncbi:hypothetical protein AX15_001501 [Amanita polypyramis BW_CC]|nr:hypothetical protein AX15_001501 [Amanita polypyramis BW_CC]
MTIRDPSDGKGMPPNGNDHVSAHCLRGVRKISPSDWRSYVLACQPDVVVALSDIPFKDPPYSQKRLAKGVDRSIKWLADILRPIAPSKNGADLHPYRPSVLVHMAGGTVIAARRAFSDSLLETLHGKEAEQVTPLRCLDEGVVGYTFDLVPLRLSLEAVMRKATAAVSSDPIEEVTPQCSVSTDHLIPLINASLEPLPATKLRAVNTAVSPHEILRVIQSSGIDLFDAHWAQRAAHVGIALDFTFPAPLYVHENASDKDAKPRIRPNGKYDIGHNLYDSVYAIDFSSLSSCFSPASATSVATDGSSDKFKAQSKPICPCLACSPMPPATRICHGPPELEVESSPSETQTYPPPFTRAYIHHLLRTHEMSAHSLLVMHNLSVLDAFFAGVRDIIRGPDDLFEREVEGFVETYDENMVVFEEASVNWRDVDLARGKGRLARERVRQESIGNLTTVHT